MIRAALIYAAVALAPVPEAAAQSASQAPAQAIILCGCAAPPGTVTVHTSTPILDSVPAQIAAFTTALWAEGRAPPPALSAPSNEAAAPRIEKRTLASGSVYTLDLYGDPLIGFAIDNATAAALLAAGPGGAVAPDTARQIIDRLVLAAGVEANTAAIEDGAVVLRAAPAPRR